MVTETGKAPQESGSLLSETPASLSFLHSKRGNLQQSRKRTLAPLNIPSLWFYACNNCGRYRPAGKLRVRAYREMSVRGGRPAGVIGGDMILCDECLPKYVEWQKTWGVGSRSFFGTGIHSLHPLLVMVERNMRWKSLQHPDTGESGEAYNAEMGSMGHE